MGGGYLYSRKWEREGIISAPRPRSSSKHGSLQERALHPPAPRSPPPQEPGTLLYPPGNKGTGTAPAVPAHAGLTAGVAMRLSFSVPMSRD